MSVLYMVRHGQASFGATNYDKLSSLGQSQSRLLADHLSRQQVLFDAAYTGQLERHHTTAEPLVAAFEKAGIALPAFRALPEFNEYDAAFVWQHEIKRMMAQDPQVEKDIHNIVKDPKAFMRLYTKALLRWASGDTDPSVGQNWTDFTARVRSGMEKIMKENQGGKTIAVFTSGGPISAALQMALDLSDIKTMELGIQVKNASITRFIYNEKSITLSVFNETPHLDIPGKAELLTHR